MRSGANVVDGQWHHLAAAFDDSQVSLYVDGKLVKQTAVARKRRGGPEGPLYFGGIPQHNIGCDGLIDEVRISNVVRPIEPAEPNPLEADAATVGLWRFDRIEGQRVEDASAIKNAAVAGATSAAAEPLRTRWAAQDDLKLLSIDTSPDESFLSLRLDTMGRLFVGGREALFVYEPLAGGGYKPRQLLYRFPPDTWITDVEIRGDDLYVITNAALYLIERGRVEREGLKPRRLIWGPPVDLHVTYHGLAWGPEGDLYFCSGDPLLNFGDFQNRADHWGHWTVFTQPEGTARSVHGRRRVLSLPPGWQPDFRWLPPARAAPTGWCSTAAGICSPTTTITSRWPTAIRRRGCCTSRRTPTSSGRAAGSPACRPSGPTCWRWCMPGWGARRPWASPTMTSRCWAKGIATACSWPAGDNERSPASSSRRVAPATRPASFRCSTVPKMRGPSA